MPKPLENSKESLAYCYALIDVYREVFQSYTNDLASGKITVSSWKNKTDDSLRTLYGLQAIAGKSGDPENIDWSVIEKRLSDQQNYLDNFASDLTNAIEDESDITSFLYRSGLYADSSKGAFWESFSPVQLPAYPGDGETECGASCLCEWQFEYGDGVVKATWITNDSKPCPTCNQRSDDYNPLVIKLSSQGLELQDDSGNNL